MVDLQHEIVGVSVTVQIGAARGAQRIDNRAVLVALAGDEEDVVADRLIPGSPAQNLPGAVRVHPADCRRAGLEHVRRVGRAAVEGDHAHDHVVGVAIVVEIVAG
jgi:hypothetical protein